MNYIKTVIIFLALSMSTPIYGQEDARPYKSKLKQIAMEFGESNWHIFKQGNQINGEHLFDEMKQDFNLSADDDMRLVSTTSDDLGYRHYRYQQTYKGIDVEGAVYCVHERDGSVVSTNGRIVQGLALSNIPVLSKSNIIEIINAHSSEKQNENTSHYEKAIKLTYTQICDTLGYRADNYVLSYTVSVGDSNYYYNANTGHLIKSFYANDNSDNCHTGTANTLYNGWQSITTKKRLNKYYLIDMCRGDKITASYNFIEYTTSNNIWNFSDPKYKAVVSAFWAAEMAYDYFYYTLNRNSYDNLGSHLCILIDDSIDGGAYWDSTSNNIHCAIGGYGYLSTVSLDVIGHELTHGIIRHTSNLDVAGEPGALKESFADIFGTMVEYYVEGDNGNYIIGEDVVPNPSGLRNMMNPNIMSHPDTYLGNYWYLGNDTGIFTHTNCGVQNHWFYLLAEGGEGMNDNNYHYQVQGIGREKAAKIAYRNMVHYMNSSCDYSDARNGAILSAVDLFGPHSDEVLSTIAAWDAVGVNNAGDLYYDYVTVCSLLETIHNVQGNPVSSIAIHNIISTCSYVPNQVPVQYYAGGTITLKDGFCSGNNFSAVIFPTTLPSSYPENMSYLSGPRTSSGTDDTTPNIGQERQYMPSVNIYPNPSRDIITILSDIAMLRVTLFDITGKQISYNQYPDNGITSSDIDVSPLPSGIYMVQALLEDGSIVTKRVIKK